MDTDSLSFMGYKEIIHEGIAYYLEMYYSYEIEGILYAGAISETAIVVDRHFMLIEDESIMDFIIDHECGHIFNGHVANPIERRDINREYIADKYAYDKNAERTLRGLKYLFYQLTQNNQAMSNLRTAKELELRYNHISGKTLVPAWYDMALKHKREMGESFKIYDGLYTIYNNALSMSSKEIANAVSALINLK